MKSFEKLLGSIRDGKDVNPYDLLPHLCVENKTTRAGVNAALSQAYSDAGDPDQAKIFAERALLLSDFSEGFFSYYIELHRSLGDIEAIKNGYKRMGMRSASSGDIGAALKNFNSSHYAYPNYRSIDKYEYDFDVLDAIERLANPHRFTVSHGQLVNIDDRKIRLAYLVFGAEHQQSILIKILCGFARFHDHSRFEVKFFVPNKVFPPELDRYNKCADANIQQLTDQGATVIRSSSETEAGSLLEIAQKINFFGADILVSTALLADLGHYFVAVQHPAPLMIGLNFGPPPQYVAPVLDWSIAASKHSLLDTPTGCSLVPFEWDFSAHASVSVYPRKHFNIPENAFVLISAGRPSKFQDRNFWMAILDVLRLNPDVYFLAIGLSEKPAFLSDAQVEKIGSRLKILGWSDDYLNILGMANCVIDTFPSGGGVTLLDAMTMAIPIVSFRNNYMRIFDQNDWSHAEEFVGIGELLIDRGNFTQWKDLLSKLIKDRTYCKKMGQLCRGQALLKSHPENMVRSYEKVYTEVIARAALAHVSAMAPTKT